MEAVAEEKKYVPIGKYGTHTFSIEKFADCWEELKPLYNQHWKETERYTEKDEPEVDTEYMEVLENAGRMMLFTTRDKSGELVGYLVYTISENLFLKGTRTAEEGGFFLSNKSRGTGVAPSFLLAAENFLREIKVSQLHAINKAPAGGTDIDRMLRRRGYEPVAIYYCKLLED